MRFREFGKRIVESSAFLRRIRRALTNEIEVENNSFSAENIHFSHNQIHLKGKCQVLYIAPTSFMRSSRVTMVGEGNCVSVDENIEIYGSDGQCIYIEGNNNRVLIGKGCRITNSIFLIHGDNNLICLEDDISCYGAEFDLRQNNNQIVIGKGTSFHGRGGYPVHMVADEGSGIYIGKDCMFSKDIQVRSSDSHSIVDLDGKRLNPAKDVVIGEHVWISLGCTVLKGAKIPDHCVLAADAVCVKEFEEEHCILAGNPAKVVRREIDWDRKFD